MNNQPIIDNDNDGQTSINNQQVSINDPIEQHNSPEYVNSEIDDVNDAIPNDVIPNDVDTAKQSNPKNKLMRSRVLRIVIIVADILAIIGFVVYCCYIQSYLSTLYLLILILMINYTYITIIKNVHISKTQVMNIHEFETKQHEIYHHKQGDPDDNSFANFCWLESHDIKKYLWVVVVSLSSLSLLFKIVIVPCLLHTEGAINLMSYYNYEGLEIYFNITNRGNINIDSDQYVSMFLPNISILVFSVLMLIVRKVKAKQPLHELSKPIRMTKFIILIILINLLVLICTTRSLIGYILWLFQLLLLYRMCQNQLIETTYIFTLKWFVCFIMILMYFASTPIQYIELDNNVNLINLFGIELLLNYQQNKSAAILFIFSTFAIFNLLSYALQQINQSILQTKLQHSITIASEDNDLYQIQLIQLENLEFGTEVVESSEAKSEQSEVKLSYTDRLLTMLQDTKLFLDRPIITLRILQILAIMIIIIQKTYFSIFLIIWVIITSFSLQKRLNQKTSIILALPSLAFNFCTFYYANIIGMENSPYQVCRNAPTKNQILQIPVDECQKFGLYIQEYSYLNILVINLTISLFILYIKQVSEAIHKHQEISPASYSEQTVEPSWLTILIAIIFKFSYIISLVLLYYVSFQQINIVQFILVLLLLIYLVNQSTLVVHENRMLVPFAYKYWILLVIYLSVLLLLKYTYMMFPNYDDKLVLQIIGIDNTNQFEIIFWTLFYFVGLQQQAFNSHIYMKYSNKIVQTIASKESVQKLLPKLSENNNFLQLLAMKSLIWLAFVVNICFLLFTPFSYINSCLLMVVGIIFLYYVAQIIYDINYQTMRRVWYFYLNLLVFTFVFRYLLQFMCIPTTTDADTGYFKFYRNLQYNFQEYGLYIFQTSNLKYEYLPDMLNIFFGALALSTFTIFSQCQIAQVDQQNGILVQLYEDNQQIAQLMNIKVLDQWTWLKQPILLIANLNTDIITVFVLLSCVFTLRSVAAFILLILYLSYFYMVHNALLNLLDKNAILNRLQKQINYLQNKYLDFKEIEHDQNEQELQLLVDKIKLLRLTTRIKLKRRVWIISFYFTAFCIFLTYLSQFLSSESSKIEYDQRWYQYTTTIFFVFGTYAKQSVTNQCFCGINSTLPECEVNDPTDTTSNIWNAAWFYLVLLFVNVIDTACTQILQEDLQNELVRVSKAEADLKLEVSEIAELEYNQNIEEQFKKQYEFVEFTPEIDKKYTQFNREALLINHYINKDRLLTITFQEAAFRVLQRVLILLFLINTVIVNTIFSLFYLGMSAYLFLQKPNTMGVRKLNKYSVFAIWFQYLLYLLNWVPKESAIPQDTNLTQQDFSIIRKLGLTNQEWLSFLGFSNSNIENCLLLKQDNSLFKNEECESNQALNWVFLINFIVLSLIYCYFLLLEQLSKSILRNSLNMKSDIQLTLVVLRANDNRNIIINYSQWKRRYYAIKQQLSVIITRNSHMLIAGLVILLSQTNRIIFNLLEMCIALGFVFLTEFHYQWPYLMKQLKVIDKYFKILFIIPIMTIACFTLLKVPYLLNICVEQTYTVESGIIITTANNGLIFYCLQVFNIRIVGMVFIMFILSLYFDLISSKFYLSSQTTNQLKEELRAKMVSLAYAYEDNHSKYKAVLKFQKTKNILQSLQETIHLKISIWNQKLKQMKVDDAGENSPIKIKKMQSQYPQMEVDKQIDETEQLNQLPFFKKFWIQSILTLREVNHTFKFMGFPALLDFILASNQQLQRHSYISIYSYLKGDTKYYKREIQFIEQFSKVANYKVIKSQFKLDDISEFVKQIVQEINNKQEWEETIPFAIKQELKTAFISYTDYRKSLELSFVHIFDPNRRVQLKQTKLQAPLQRLLEFETIQLFGLAFGELCKFIIAKWQSVTYIFIILYFAKNSAILGSLLPLLMFVWVLVDDSTPTSFWLISYSMYTFILLLVFTNTLFGLDYLQILDEQSIKQQSWYAPLDNSNSQGLFFEIFIMWLIVFQVFLQKQFGVYYTKLISIENTFRGYIRLKLNSFNKQITQEVEDEQIEEQIKRRSESVVSRQAMEVEQELQEQLQVQVQVQEDMEQLDQVDVDAPNEQYRNEIERKILKNPLLLTNKYKPSFIQRIFSFELSRPGVDLYIWIFGVQMILLVYILIFFNYMTHAQQDINQILKFNQVPGSLVLALTAHLLLMVTERYIELRDDKLVIAVIQQDTQITDKKQQQSLLQKYKLQFILKYALQIMILILVYWFVFVHLGKPWQGNKINDVADETISLDFISNSSIICFFLLYCAYFYLSALQLRYGYRELKIRNQILYSFNQISYLVAKTFYAIPFLFELKTLMDWTFIETSLDVFQWFILEDIHGLLFFTKNQSLGYFRRKLGEKIAPFMKCTMGCTFVLFILLCIIGPLMLFSTLNPSSTVNLVKSGQFQISLVNVKSSLSVVLYSTNQLYGIEEGDLSKGDINEAFGQVVSNPIIIGAPSKGGLQRFQLVSFSDINWDVSLPLYNELLDQLAAVKDTIDTGFLLNVSYVFQRENQNTLPTPSRFSYPYNPALMGYDGHQTTYLQTSDVQELYNSIYNCSGGVMVLPNFYIEALQIYSTDGISFTAKPIIGDGVNSVMNVAMSLQCGQGTLNPIEGPAWWNFTYLGDGYNLNPPNTNGLLLFIVSDKYSPLTYGFSIITIYTSVILLIGSFIRTMFSGQVWMMEFTGMMQPDDLLMICEAISVARSSRDFKKENILYFEMIDIIRSPEIVKVMTGSWSEHFNNQQQQQSELKQPDGQQKLKQD